MRTFTMAISSSYSDFTGSRIRERNSTCSCGYRSQRASSFTNMKAVPPTVRGNSRSSSIVSFGDISGQRKFDKEKELVERELGPDCLGIAVLGRKMLPNDRQIDKLELRDNDDTDCIQFVEDATFDGLGKWSAFFSDRFAETHPKAPCPSPVTQSPRLPGDSNTQEICSLNNQEVKEAERPTSGSVMPEDKSSELISEAKSVENTYKKAGKVPKYRYKKHLQFLIPVGDETYNSDEICEPTCVDEASHVSTEGTENELTNNTFGNTDHNRDSHHRNIRPSFCREETTLQKPLKGKTVQFLSENDVEYPPNTMSQRILETLIFMDSIQEKGRLKKEVKTEDKLITNNANVPLDVRSETALHESKAADREICQPPEMTVNKKQAVPRPRSDYQMRTALCPRRPLSSKRPKSSRTRKTTSSRNVCKVKPKQGESSDGKKVNRPNTRNDATDEEQLLERLSMNAGRKTPLIWERIIGEHVKEPSVLDIDTEELEKEFQTAMIIEKDSLEYPSPVTQGTAEADDLEMCKNDLSENRQDSLPDRGDSGYVNANGDIDNKRNQCTQSKKEKNLRPTARVKQTYKEHKKKLNEAEQKPANSFLNLRIRPKSSHPRLQATKAASMTALEINTKKQPQGKQAQIAWEAKSTKGEKVPKIKVEDTTKRRASVQEHRQSEAAKSKTSTRPVTAKGPRRNEQKVLPLGGCSPKEGRNGHYSSKRRPISAPVGKFSADRRIMAEDAPSKECEDVFSKCRNAGVKISMKTLCRGLMPPSEDHRLQSYTQLPSAMTGLLTRPDTWFR